MKRPRSQLRLRNLERLVAEAGSAASLARLARTNASYLSQIRRGLPTARGAARGVGDELAEKLERAMGKPAGWMDEPHLETGEDRSAGYAEPPPRRDRGGACPLVSWAEAAQWGRRAAAILADPERERLPCPVPCGVQTFVVRTEGESMTPVFLPEDLLFVDPAVSPTSGRYVVARSDGAAGVVVRQLLVEGTLEFLKASNPDWPERIVPFDGAIVGVIVFKGTAL